MCTPNTFKLSIRSKLGPPTWLRYSTNVLCGDWPGWEGGWRGWRHPRARRAGPRQPRTAPRGPSPGSSCTEAGAGSPTYTGTALYTAGIEGTLHVPRYILVLIAPVVPLPPPPSDALATSSDVKGDAQYWGCGTCSASCWGWRCRRGSDPGYTAPSSRSSPRSWSRRSGRVCSHTPPAQSRSWHRQLLIISIEHEVWFQWPTKENFTCASVIHYNSNK